MERFETLSEIRAHLVASAAAYEELGLSPVEAMTAAIDSFGDIRKIGREVMIESASPERSRLSGFVSVGVGSISSAMLFPLADAAFVVTHTVSNPSPGMAAIGAVTGFFLGLCLFLRPRTLPVAALRAGLFVPTILLILVCLLNRAIPGLKFLGLTFLGFGVVNAMAAAFVVRSLRFVPTVRGRKLSAK